MSATTPPACTIYQYAQLLKHAKACAADRRPEEMEI